MLKGRVGSLARVGLKLVCRVLGSVPNRGIGEACPATLYPEAHVLNPEYRTLCRAGQTKSPKGCKKMHFGAGGWTLTLRGTLLGKSRKVI